MTNPNVRPDLEALKSMLAPGPVHPWQDHDGGNRPNKPADFCEIEFRDGGKARVYSGLVRWWWATPLDDEEDPNSDPIRWRPTKAPPLDFVIAGHVPDLIAHIERLEAGLREIMKPGCGAGLDWADDELASYWSSQTTRCRSIARATLSQGTSND